MLADSVARAPVNNPADNRRAVNHRAGGQKRVIDVATIGNFGVNSFAVSFRGFCESVLPLVSPRSTAEEARPASPSADAARHSQSDP